MCLLTRRRAIGHFFARTARLELIVVCGAAPMALEQSLGLRRARVNGGLCLLGRRQFDQDGLTQGFVFGWILVQKFLRYRRFFSRGRDKSIAATARLVGVAHV